MMYTVNDQDIFDAEFLEDQIVQNLKGYEGYKPTWYTDTEGYETIGFGFKKDSLRLSRQVSSLILREKINDLYINMAVYPWFLEINPNARMVLVELSYQVGIAGMLKFKKMLKAIQDNDYITASKEILDSKLARQTPQRVKDLSKRLLECRNLKKSAQQ